MQRNTDNNQVKTLNHRVKVPRVRTPYISLTLSQLKLIVDKVSGQREFTQTEEDQLGKIDVRLNTQFNTTTQELLDRVDLPK